MKKSRAMSVLGNILFYTIVVVVILILILIGISLFTPAEFPRISCTMYYSLVGLYNRIDHPQVTEFFRIKQLFISFSRIICKPRLVHYGIPGTEWYERKKWCIDIRKHLTGDGWNYFYEKGYLPESCDKLKEFLENWTNRRKYFLFLANFLVAKNIKTAYEEIGKDYGSLFDKDPILRIVCISYPGKKLVFYTKFPEWNPDYALFIRIPGEGTNTTIDPDISVKNILNYFKSNPFRQTTGEEYIWATMRDWNYTNIGDYVFRWCPIRYWERYGNNIVYYDCSNSPHARWLANFLDKISVCVLIGVDFWDDPEGDNKNNVIVTKGSIVTYPYPLLFYKYYKDPWSNLDRSKTYLERVYKIRIRSYGEWLHFFEDESFDYDILTETENGEPIEHSLIWNFGYIVTAPFSQYKAYIDPYLNFYTPVPKYIRLYNHLLRVLLTQIYSPRTCNGITYYILNESLTDPANPPRRHYSAWNYIYVRSYFYNASNGEEYNYIPYRNFSECPFSAAPKFFKEVKLPLAGILPNLTVDDFPTDIVTDACNRVIKWPDKSICEIFHRKIMGYTIPAAKDLSFYMIQLPNSFDIIYFYKYISDLAIEASYCKEEADYMLFFIDQENPELYYKMGSKEYSIRVPLILEPHLYVISKLSSFTPIPDVFSKEDYENLFQSYVDSPIRVIKYNVGIWEEGGEYKYYFSFIESPERQYILKLLGGEIIYTFMLG